MCLRVSNFSNANFLSKVKFFTNFRLVHNKYVLNMDRAYLRQQEETGDFQLTFRKLSEPVSAFTTRAAANLEKAVNKKLKKRKINEEKSVNQPTIIKVAVLLNGVELSGEETFNEIFKTEHSNGAVTLKVLEKLYKIIINSPFVDTLTLPKSILANFLVYPSKFEAVYTDRSKSDFKWYKSNDRKQWTHVGSDYLYSPSNDDINSYLKLTCIPKLERTKTNIVEGPLIEVISEVPVDASPGLCPFELRQNFTKKRLTNGNEFRVMTYNILADLYCDSDFTRTELHPYCPPYALAIDYRKQLFVKEIIGFNADLICLQEVDRKIYNYDLKPTLSHLGYDSDYALKGAEVAEGLACFYDKSRFKHLENHRVVLSEVLSNDPIYQDIWEKVQSNEKLRDRILERTTTLQANVLEFLESGTIIIVANTHLYFHPDADHIRLLQGALCIRFLENLVINLKKKYGENKSVSLIFCGDFNSVPDCGIYKLYTTGTVPHDFIDFQSNKEEAVQDLNLRQSFQLGSACGTPKYTNFTSGFADCLDYIFYDSSNLTVENVIPLPTLEELNEHTALPSIVFPSDHISLVADFKLLK